MIKDGIINIYKEAGMTSHDVVRDLRRILNTKKIGHTGTLDPMATGVLPVCVGKATRVCEYLDLDFKTYRCTMSLGIITDTQDIWGEILEVRDTSHVTPDMVLDAFKQFHGLVEQKPPMYSAVRVDGRRLYDYARAGETVDVKTRKIYIKNIEVELIDFAHDSNTKKITFLVECSKGTYIRTICQDVGQALGCGGTMESLERIKSGSFSTENAFTINQLREMQIDQIEEKMVGIDFPLIYFGTVLVDDEVGKRFIDGWHISMKECEIIQRPALEDALVDYPIREEYRRAYKIYKGKENPEFLGVAFYNFKYKKLVADKVFYRSENDSL